MTSPEGDRRYGDEGEWEGRHGEEGLSWWRQVPTWKVMALHEGTPVRMKGRIG